ncbi:FecR family protein [Ancylomarina longa]|uniref:FecR family protein n=1 Tax=Ancylomarina longa TaxID=2487017 RepID=A0A434AX80_9BACT|nr:FecR family protein [Ancylomarina longa]RUT79019.1 FecR family protein [Ancylomarina longa]
MKENYNNIFGRIKQNISSNEDHEKVASLFGKQELEYEISDALFGQLEKMDEENTDGIDLNSLYKRLWLKINAKEKEHKSTKHRILLIRVASIAVIMAIGLIVGAIFTPLNQNSDLAFVTIVAPKGSISQMYLPDSTLIYLNAGSEIKYRMDQGDGNREVFLSGEAWFKVTKNQNKPFVVNTPYYNVKVLGTEFNVRAYENDKDVTTTLEEGSIQIISGRALTIQQPILIKPEEQISYNKLERKINIKEVNSSLYSSWKDNKLIFINKNFSELADILERKYGVEIQVKDTSINKYHYDGTIKDETIFEMLNRIQSTLPIKYRIEGQKIIIEKDKCSKIH